jgi:GGDEF domain-containing protein
MESDKQYTLSCSCGAEIFSREYASLEQFLRHVDMLMYDNKRLKKQNAPEGQ